MASQNPVEVELTQLLQRVSPLHEVIDPNLGSDQRNVDHAATYGVPSNQPRLTVELSQQAAGTSRMTRGMEK